MRTCHEHVLIRAHARGGSFVRERFSDVDGAGMYAQDGVEAGACVTAGRTTVGDVSTPPPGRVSGRHVAHAAAATRAEPPKSCMIRLVERRATACGAAMLPRRAQLEHMPSAAPRTRTFGSGTTSTQLVPFGPFTGVFILVPWSIHRCFHFGPIVHSPHASTVM